MMHQIVECIPNFSDGRNPAVYEAIAAAIRSVRGIHVLGVSPDRDHNRTVITFVGPPDGVEEAAFRAIATAAEHINLDHHFGEHPRIGATDVCPFVPVRGVTMVDCVAMAERVGARVGSELGIAVYLYARAAKRPDRTKLSDIRKGEYELWKEEVATNPKRLPDFGPAVPKQWGATVIGARPFLIAYNLYLNANDVGIAEQIAKNIRFLNGGLRFLQAKGFLVEGQAQVSMNLTNFVWTPLHRVQELVRREAAQYGLTVTKAELVGLMPRQALIDAAKWYLQLHDLQDDQILEHSYREADEREETIRDFLMATAEATATPGGGASGALAGALAASLTQMVAGLTVGRRKYAAVEAEAQTILDEALQLQQRLRRAIQEDSNAFAEVMAVRRDKGLDAATKQVMLERAMIHAGEVPLQVARMSRTVAQLAYKIAQIGNVYAATDATAGAIMARAAVEVAVLNVRANAMELQNRTLAQAWLQEVSELETAVFEVVDMARRLIDEKMEA